MPNNSKPSQRQLGDVVLIHHPEHDELTPVVFLEYWNQLPGYCLCFSIDKQGEELLWAVPADLVEEAPPEAHKQLAPELEVEELKQLWWERRAEILKLVFEELGGEGGE